MPQLDLNSKCNYISFPQTQQQMMNQSNSFMSKSESHLDDVSGSEFDFHLPIRTKIMKLSPRCTAHEIEESGTADDMYDGYCIANFREISDSEQLVISNGPTLVDESTETRFYDTRAVIIKEKAAIGSHVLCDAISS